MIVPDRAYVMIIDDDNNLCDLLSTMLYTRNVNVLCAYSIQEAENHISIKQPFLVFLDNSLPDGLGIDFLTRVKTTYPDLKVVMITADATEELKQQALTEGVIGFLEKPFSYLRIKELLEQAMETQHF